jgi:phage terminase small subunit
MESLTPKQRRFCEEYILDLDPAEAYKRAGYKVSTDDSARNAASRLLGNVGILNYVKILMDQRSERTAITADKVIQEISGIAFAKITDFISVTGCEVICKPSSEWPQEVAGSIVEYSRYGHRVSVKMGDKLGALKLLYEHLGLGLDFNRSVQSLRKYGLELYRDENGTWKVKDLSRANSLEAEN